MTITEQSVERNPIAAFRPVAFDLYRDIHKGIRSELFAITSDAGRLDPSDREGRIALSNYVHSTVDFLVLHAEHEDRVIRPVLLTELPALAAQVEREHEALEARMLDLCELGSEAVAASAGEQRTRVHQLYRELASFTSDYLAHQQVEERVIMPALEDAVGVEAVIGMHVAIVSNIPPDTMAQSLAIMFPAMNIDDRAELLTGMRADAPPEVFAGVWSLVGSVLTPCDYAELGARLGL